MSRVRGDESAAYQIGQGTGTLGVSIRVTPVVGIRARPLFSEAAVLGIAVAEIPESHRRETGPPRPDSMVVLPMLFAVPTS
jgi:hypothetical protein